MISRGGVRHAEASIGRDVGARTDQAEFAQ
jgi:hypothetical protein